MSSWSAADQWASDLVVDGVDDWRLAGSNPVSCVNGYCRRFEFEYLYLDVLGGLLGTSIQLHHNANFDLFDQVASQYWTGDRDSNYAWTFSMFNGSLSRKGIGEGYLHAWAVRDGDVLAVTSPGGVLIFLALMFQFWFVSYSRS